MFRVRLRELREAAGYKSQQAFADAFGVAQSTVGNWEAGKRQPNYDTTIRLAAFFGVTVDYLLGTEKEEAPAPVAEGRREIQKEDMMAAFWGGDKDLSPEELDAMWQDVERFAAFVAEKKRQEKEGRK